jgi:hypothetical protein
MEDIVENMRRNIHIELVGGRNPQDPVDAFRVNFTYADARTAMRVTEQLASLFINENLRDRGSLAEAPRPPTIFSTRSSSMHGRAWKCRIRS